MKSKAYASEAQHQVPNTSKGTPSKFSATSTTVAANKSTC